jgi:hypothetical protein
MNRSHGRAGQSLIESALVLTAFMGLLVGMATLGQSLFVRQTLADRARMAARWGALSNSGNYDAAAIRRVVLYGSAEPAPGDTPFLGLTPTAVDVSNPGCPGPECRISVSIPEYGIRRIEPMQPAATPSQTTTPAPVASQP